MNSTIMLHGRYDHGLVVLSVMLAIFAAYAALDLAGRVASSHGHARAFWLGAGAAAMGVGTWTTHYVGMLALSMPMPVYYHIPTVLISLLAAIAASGVALVVVSQPKMDVWHEIGGSVAMGAGIAAMHYVGMAALRCSAVVVYDLRIVALSIGLAMAGSLVALMLAFRVRADGGMSRRKIISALVMGSAIPVMHYTGMWSANFHASSIPPDMTHAAGISTVGLMALSVSNFGVQGGAIASSYVDRVMSAHRSHLNLARERELYFQTMAEAVPEIIWTAGPDGGDDYFNQRCYDYTGRTFEQMQGSAWVEIIHPEDSPGCLTKWQTALRTGEAYDVEYRLRGKDGSYRWFLGRAKPIRNAEGEIIKWFGTCTDIESQKHSQQILEEQILERTAQLADVNTRLQEEMIEKDFARNELDQQNERMMGELRERTQRATMLAKMGELLQSCMSREEVFAAALGYAPKIFPSSPGAIALLDASRSVAEVIGSWSDCRLAAMVFELSSCWALRTGHPHLVVAGDTTARCAHAEGVKNTYLCIPILAQGETLGVLHLQATEATPHLESADLSLKTTFAGQVGLSIANIRLREALRTQSVRDALTGLYNRRYLEEVLQREVRRAARAAQSLGVLIVDLDHFKNFNDTYGHDAGDAVLRETGQFLSKGIRAEDFVCRFGGEEFVVILPTADVDASRARAERLRLKMRELTVMYQGKSLGMVTISIGVASFPQHAMSPKELMAAADAALYQAKRAGRDRVGVAAGRIEEEAGAAGQEKPEVSWS